jgi:signal transduction histidine kinase
VDRWERASIRARTTLAATAAAAICFGTGAFWLRHELYANRYEASIAQALSDAPGLAVAHASGNDDRMLRYEGFRWIAIDAANRIRATDTNQKATVEGAPVVSPDPLREKVDPARLRSAVRLLTNGTEKATVQLGDDTATFVVADVWTDRTGHIVLDPPYLVRPDAGVYIDPAVAPSRVSYFVLVSPAEAEAATRAVDPVLIVALPAAVALIAAVAWLSVGRALRPVEAISDELAAITAANLNRRVPVPDTGDEIEGLALTTNATLDRLEDAVTRQRRFVADAAHELRSPLAGLRNTVEVAQATAAPEDLPAALDVVLASTRRLQDLTDDLLLLARLDRPETRPRTPVDLAAVVEEQVAERRYGDGGRVEFTATVTGPVVVPGDQRQLERLVRNLLDNADRHADTAVSVAVSRAGGEAVVEVVDDGGGIDPEDRELVFQPFTRLDDARARDSGGTGLGLAIARNIAAGHGGRIEVDNVPGARFTVHLPAEPGAA